MSRSNAFEVKTKLSEDVLKDKRNMNIARGKMIAGWILFGLALPAFILFLLMETNKIHNSIGFATIVLVILFGSISLFAVIYASAYTKGFFTCRRYYNWDLDAMEDGYKYVEDAMRRDERAEEELEKRRAKREAKERKRGYCLFFIW